jgi:sugar/nucleoside kinase (ribokinase family)
MALDLFNERFSPWWEEYLAQYAVVLFMLNEIAMSDKKEEEEKAVRYI